MGRVNMSKWHPSVDSTPSLKPYAHEDGNVHLLLKPSDATASGFSCPCGCGELPKGKKTKFAMGHDARMKGVLIRAHLSEAKVVWHVVGSDEKPDPQDAFAIANVYGWTSYLKAAEERRDAAQKKLLASVVGSERLVKVGRWEYTGTVAAILKTDKGDVFEVKYVDKQGNTKSVKVPASEVAA